MTSTNINERLSILSSALRAVPCSLTVGLARLCLFLLPLLICLGLLTRVVCFLLLPYGWLAMYGTQKFKRGLILIISPYHV